MNGFSYQWTTDGKHIPKLLTRHFLDEDQKYYQKVSSVKFGRFSYYSSAEAVDVLSSRSDPTEGSSNTIYTTGGEVISDIHAGKALRADAASRVVGSFSASTTAKGWAFCLSCNGYNKERHRKLIAGDGYSYKGNRHLTSYAVFRSCKLIEAIKMALRTRFNLSEEELIASIKCGPIYYDKPEEAVKIGTGFRSSQPHLFDAIFTKQPKFSVEDEYRIVILPSEKIPYKYNEDLILPLTFEKGCIFNSPRRADERLLRSWLCTGEM